MKRAVLMGLVLWLLVGCGGGGALRLGTKGFAEQRIVAHVVRQLMMASHGERAQVIDCGDTYECEAALRQGKLDALMEYSGTAALYLGIDPAAGDATARVTAAYAQRDLVWRPSLGFDNGYVLVMAARQAHARGVTTIADLTKLEDGVRLACPRTYLRRPGDGLAALLERHGLRLAGEAVVIASAADRIGAVLDGRVDVAVAYGTDGALETGGLTLLDDGLDFFPSYAASYVVRQAALDQHPALGATLTTLEGRIDDAAIRDLNHAVQLEGWQPADIARRFLVEGKLVTDAEPATSKIDLTLAVATKDDFGATKTRGLLALRRVFPERPLRVAPIGDPIDEVARGGAKLALLGAERFFRQTRRGLRRHRGVEAVAVVGSRMVHLLAREPGATLAGRIGIGARGSGAAIVGNAVVQAAGLTAAMSTGNDQLVAALNGGQLDVALVVVEPGAEVAAQALAAGLHLRPLPNLLLDGAPFLRRSRIAANTYAGQSAPVETLASQVVLAGPSRAPHPTGLKGGPAAALLVEAKPLTIEQAQLLADATGVAELPDPVLPTAHVAAGDVADLDDHALLDTMLNLALWLFLAWLAYLTVRRDEPAES